MTLFVASSIHRRIKFLSEIELEEGGREIAIEFAALDLELDPLLVLRGGIIMNPIGAFNQNHDGPKWEFTDRPLAAQRMLPATWSNVGFGAFGKHGSAWQAEFLAQRLAPLDAGAGMAKLAPGLALGMASPHAPHDAIARAAVLMSSVPEATYRKALQAIAGFNRREGLGDLRLPVLCLAGEHDRNAPPAVLQQMASRIPGAEYQCLPGVGHLANMEAPAPFNRALIDFLQRRF